MPSSGCSPPFTSWQLCLCLPLSVFLGHTTVFQLRRLRSRLPVFYLAGGGRDKFSSEFGCPCFVMRDLSSEGMCRRLSGPAFTVKDSLGPLVQWAHGVVRPCDGGPPSSTPSNLTAAPDPPGQIWKPSSGPRWPPPPRGPGSQGPGKGGRVCCAGSALGFSVEMAVWD